MSPLVTAIILVKDEERHIKRALASVSKIADRCYVVDSGSIDRTVEFAEAAGAIVLRNKWVNYATQFNWALDQMPSDTQWILRLDADEIVTKGLEAEVRAKLPTMGSEVSGLNVSRRMCFLGRPIRWGGIFPIRVVRLFRWGRGRIENRWMDEHVIVSGAVKELRGEIVDDNINSLTWWIQKHNSYASREAVDNLNLVFAIFDQETVASLSGAGQAGSKRWIKEKIYNRLPLGMRALIYFLYRYIIRFGFLDGREGVAFHVLQGFWYRYLVDLKIHEVRTYMDRNNVAASDAIRDVLSIDVTTRQ